MTLLVELPGPLSLVQDLGRPGLGHLGVSPSGSFDRRAARQANAILANPVGRPLIESLGGLVLRAESAHAVAVTGASSDIAVDGRTAPYGRAVLLRPGQVLRLGIPTTGMRTYVGVAGGLNPGSELGSASTDTLSGLGPAPLRSGERLAVGPSSAIPDLEDVPPLGSSGDATLDVMLGPRDDWFTPEAVRLLLEHSWQVSPDSSRIGVRLVGATLERSRHDELPSEPCVRGSIQIASDGQPIVLGPDHPVTGGYPVMAVVADTHGDRLAQVRPGQVVRFRRTF